MFRLSVSDKKVLNFFFHVLDLIYDRLVKRTESEIENGGIVSDFDRNFIIKLNSGGIQIDRKGELSAAAWKEIELTGTGDRYSDAVYIKSQKLPLRFRQALTGAQFSGRIGVAVYIRKKLEQNS